LTSTSTNGAYADREPISWDSLGSQATSKESFLCHSTEQVLHYVQKSEVFSHIPSVFLSFDKGMYSLRNIKGFCEVSGSLYLNIFKQFDFSIKKCLNNLRVELLAAVFFKFCVCLFRG